MSTLQILWIILLPFVGQSVGLRILEGSSLIADWGPKIDVVGFCFLDLASNYEPPESLVKWLEAGDKPIYIGFGSLVSNIFAVFSEYTQQ